jgi:hypothetical protein
VSTSVANGSRPAELDDPQWLRQAYDVDGDTAIAERLQVSRSAVRLARERLGIQSRPPGRRRGQLPPPASVAGPDASMTPAAARIVARIAQESQWGRPPGTSLLVAARIRAVHDADRANDRLALEDALAGAASALGLWLDRLLVIPPRCSPHGTGLLDGA